MTANSVPLVQLSEDPDDPDYRYPTPGERLWHRWGCWVVVADEQDPGDAIIPAVAVVVDSEGGADGSGSPLTVGDVVVVKVKSLYEPEEVV